MAPIRPISLPTPRRGRHSADQQRDDHMDTLRGRSSARAGVSEGSAASTQGLLACIGPEGDVRCLRAAYRRVCGGRAGGRLVLVHGRRLERLRSVSERAPVCSTYQPGRRQQAEGRCDECEDSILAALGYSTKTRCASRACARRRRIAHDRRRRQGLQALCVAVSAYAFQISLKLEGLSAEGGLH
ncbi:hypothetical protein BJ912DRAFT_286659 [Pholiota molesta]|nr:hypothetical protein BJ912DRAFT_286659 [Pholiota molesta]